MDIPWWMRSIPTGHLMDLYALSYNSQLMSAAQAHADWIVETGNGGHTGAGGSDETVRAMWAGYGNGASIHCDEAWASTDSIESAVYSAWSDWIHQAVMLDYWGNGYTDAGGGVARNGNGSYVYIFDLCMVSGKPASNAPTAVNTQAYDSNGAIVEPTADLSQFISSVKVAAPAADGSITHVVDYGQTLVQIALAYGVKVADIRDLNYMAEDSTLIYPEQKLLIKAATSKVKAVSTGTPESTAQSGESTAVIGTEPTLAPSFTPRVRPTKTATITSTLLQITPTPTPQQSTGMDVKSIGVVLVVGSLIGLAAFLLFGGKKST